MIILILKEYHYIYQTKKEYPLDEFHEALFILKGNKKTWYSNFSQKNFMELMLYFRVNSIAYGLKINTYKNDFYVILKKIIYTDSVPSAGIKL